MSVEFLELLPSSSINMPSERVFEDERIVDNYHYRPIAVDALPTKESVKPSLLERAISFLIIGRGGGIPSPTDPYFGIDGEHLPGN